MAVLKSGQHRPPWVPYLLLTLVLLAPTIPLMLQTGRSISGTRDETRYHYKAIITFRNQFPYLELRDYSSATTPLYHTTLMLVSFVVGPGLVQLRLASAVISLFCVLVVYRHLYRRGGSSLKALIFSLIIMLSPYFLRSTIMLFTDNMALLFAILALMMLDNSHLITPRFLVASLFTLCAVLTRQCYAWLIGTILIASTSRQRTRTHIHLKAALSALIPISGLAFFAYLWKGLTPIGFSGRHQATTLNWDVPVYIVSLVGLYGSFFTPWLLRLHRQEKRGKALCIVGLVALGAAYLIVHPVSNEYYIKERGGALWKITTYLPTLLSSSIVYWFLFPLGLIYVYTILSYLARQKNRIMPASFILWMAANMISERTYQRYYEPFLLFFIGYTLVPLKVERWYDWIGPAILLVGFVGTGFLYFGPGLFPT